MKHETVADLLRASAELRQHSRQLSAAVAAAQYTARTICQDATQLRQQAAQDRHTRQAAGNQQL